MKMIRKIGSLAFVLGLFTVIFTGIPWHIITTEDPAVPWWLKIAVFALIAGMLTVLLSLALETKMKQTAGQTLS